MFLRCGLIRVAGYLMAAALTSANSSRSHADLIGAGDNAFTIDFVTIGNAGNAPRLNRNPSPAGAVGYEYRISKYEISEHVIDRANLLSAEAGSPLGISHDDRGPLKPATSVSWIEAARFTNWLNLEAGFAPAYKFNAAGDFLAWEDSDTGYDAANVYRNTQAAYFLPSADEWFKAAYYDPVSDSYFDYPTASNTIPTPISSGTGVNTAVYQQAFSTGPADIDQAGSESPNGTVAQGGNVWEWEETDFDLDNGGSGSVSDQLRGTRGGTWSFNNNALAAWSRTSNQPDASGDAIGFRVASVVLPDPIAGDYDRDRIVTSLDYEVWRNQYGLSGIGYSADGNGDGFVDAADYTVWRDNLGAQQSLQAFELVQVPEPSSALIIASLVSHGVSLRRRRD